MQMYVRVVGIVISVTGWAQEHALHKFRKAYLWWSCADPSSKEGCANSESADCWPSWKQARQSTPSHYSYYTYILWWHDITPCPGVSWGGGHLPFLAIFLLPPWNVFSVYYCVIGIPIMHMLCTITNKQYCYILYLPPFWNVDRPCPLKAFLQHAQRCLILYIPHHNTMLSIRLCVIN